MTGGACASCRQPAGGCARCDRPAAVHEHVSGYWYCSACWAVLAAHSPLDPTSQDVDAFRVTGAG